MHMDIVWAVCIVWSFYRPTSAYHVHDGETTQSASEGQSCLRKPRDIHKHILVVFEAVEVGW